VERYAALTESYTGTLPPTVIAGFHETLRSEAVTRASGVEEIRQIAVMIELTGESYEYVKLLRAISREGYGVEGGTQDVRRMLQRLTLQSDSVLDIPVGEDADAQRMTLRGLYPSLITAMGVALPPRERIAWLEASVAPAARLGRPFAILAQLGHLAFDARAYPRAASWYEKAILDSLSAPDDGGVMLSLIHSNLGIIQFDAEPPAALASFLHATTYPGASAVAWSNLGFAYFRTARFAESEKSFVVTLRMDSSNVNALYCLGRLSVGRRETHASGLWLLQRFLALERNTMRSKDLARWLASM
jgi:tetratricopeptide (TPR) repeat protein